LSPSEISACLWVGNQWQMQLMSQQLTVVNEHNKASQILSHLYLLLFYRLYLFGVFVTDVFTISSIWCFCPWKKFSFFTALYHYGVFLTNKYYFLNNSNKCIQMSALAIFNVSIVTTLWAGWLKFGFLQG
jgi:hypothetical protein